MHLMPSMADKMQAWMFKLMPFIMLVIFYTFPSGLVLYWTVQSLLGILQVLVEKEGQTELYAENASGDGTGAGGATGARPRI